MQYTSSVQQQGSYLLHACALSGTNTLYPFWQALGTLPGEKLAGVLNIVAEGKSALGMNGNGDELELDIDQLDDDTLLKLEKYTTGVLAVRPQTLGSMASSDLPSILRAPN